MNTWAKPFRQQSRAVLTLLCIAVLPTPVHAADQRATFELHPHCIERDAAADDWVFGPIPAPGIVANTRGGGTKCSNFEVLDPQTLQTPPLNAGDILDIDLIISNPDEYTIDRVRAWLIYDPNLLAGELLEISEKFSIVTPDEKDFSSTEGYVKMEASAAGKGPKMRTILFARMQFKVLKTNSIGTPITFYDVQPNGHSVIMTKEKEESVYIVKDEPGTLLVTFAKSGAGFTEPIDTNDNDDGGTNIFDTPLENIPVEPEPEIPEPEPEPLQQPIDDNSCLRNEDCPQGVCTAGQCTEAVSLLPNGAECIADAQCESGLCGSGLCVPSLRETDEDISETDAAGSRTAYSLLQIRNLRVTTDGSSAFLAWDPLKSSKLKAYNVYYGVTSGQYIQRRTIDKTEASITLRSLPLNKRYFFAVRALSTQDEESAFSREVSIIIGDPNSSTAPLIVGSLLQGNGRNPIGNISDFDGSGTVPGETGLPSVLIFFFIGSAVIGTYFASRRQFAITHRYPHAK